MASHTFLVWEQNYSMEITLTPSICNLMSKPIFSLTISLEKSRQAVREQILVMLKTKLLCWALQVLPSPTQSGSPSMPPWQTAPQPHSACSFLKGRDHHQFLTKHGTAEPCRPVVSCQPGEPLLYPASFAICWYIHRPRTELLNTCEYNVWLCIANRHASLLFFFFFKEFKVETGNGCD